MVRSKDNVTEGTMPDEEKMTIDERYKYLRIQQKRYGQAKRKERSQMLDEMEQVTGLDRKTLIRHMRRKVITRRPRRRQRGKTYGHEVDDALRVIAESFDYICAERLQPGLVTHARDLARHSELQVSADLLDKLEHLSLSTLRRRLRKFAKLDLWRLPQRQGRRFVNPLTRDIPMKRIPWDEQQPGHFEVDLVHHGGATSAGHYVHTLQMIDVATGWSERVAILGRSALVMQDAFLRILVRLPFPLLELHPDNGQEFFNDLLLRLWRDKVKGVQLSRSRPFHKNDNPFVEQKNFTLVRAYFGDWRFDTVAQTRLLNLIYDKMWLPKVQLLPTRLAPGRQNRHPDRRPACQHTTQVWTGSDPLATSLRCRCCAGAETPAAGSPTTTNQSTTPAPGDLRPAARSLLTDGGSTRPHGECPGHPLGTHSYAERRRHPGDLFI
jgi:hypothetical protein